MTKIQLEVDKLIDAVFLDESRDIRTTLEENNREMKEQLENWRGKNWKSLRAVQIMDIIQQKLTPIKKNFWNIGMLIQHFLKEIIKKKIF